MLEMNYTLKIILGYILSIGYSIIIVLFGEALFRCFKVSRDITRKIVHIMSCLLWIICYFFFGPCIHLVIMNGISALLLIPLVLGDTLKSIQRNDASHSYGMLWFAFSTLIVASIAVFVNADWYILTGIPYFCLTLGDGFAPFFAKLSNRFKYKVNRRLFKEKTLIGLIAVLLFSFLSVVIFNYLFKLNFSLLFMISLACFAALLEQYALFDTDNMLLELGIFGYLIFNYFGLVSNALCVCFIICIPFLIMSSFSKSLKPSGYIISFWYFVILSFCLNYIGLVTVAILFFVEAIISKLTVEKFNNKSKIIHEKTERSGYQIICTGFATLCSAILYYFFKKQIFLLAAITTIATEFADSVSSDIGRLSSKEPIDILRFKRIPTGISGGVSLLGLVAGVITSCIACALPYICVPIPITVYFIMVAIAFFGVLLDSILGSSLQVLYRCPMCNLLTESKQHGDHKTSRIKGIKFINNSAINLITSIVIGFISIGILWPMSS